MHLYDYIDVKVYSKFTFIFKDGHEPPAPEVN